MSEPREPREELNDLLNGAIDVACDALEQDGEFEPFALALRLDGETMHLSPDEGGEETDDEQVVASLGRTLRESASQYRAVAVVADVTLEDESGEATTAAIQIALEHAADEEPALCYVAYEFAGEKLELGDLIAEVGERVVFVGERKN